MNDHDFGGVVNAGGPNSMLLTPDRTILGDFYSDAPRLAIKLNVRPG